MPDGRVGMIVQSRAFREVLDLVDVVAPTEATVLILGETGTGKERMARAVHDGSPRRSHPIVIAVLAPVRERELRGDSAITDRL